MTINLPRDVNFILNTLELNGYEAYVVGGCVRDSLLGREVHDYDICTSAMPYQTKECFYGYNIVETGIKHGTVTLVLTGGSYEITTYRVDGDYDDNRHPVNVQFTSYLKADLCRRDFTINALAYNNKLGLINQVGGMYDLSHKVITCVGDADKRFQEDALRILRALRFAAVLGFEIEESTYDAIHRNRELLKNVSAERINSELCKMLCGDYVESILLDFTDVFGVFLPEILPMVGFEQNNPHHCYDVYTHTVKSITNAPKDLIVRLTMLFHDIGKPESYTFENGVGHFYGHPLKSKLITSDIMRRLKFDNKTIQQIETLVLYHDYELLPSKGMVKKLLNNIGEENLRKLVNIRKADISAQTPVENDDRLVRACAMPDVIDEVLGAEQCFTLNKLVVNGYDLMSIGIPQGCEIGDLLKMALRKVIRDELPNDKEIILEYIKYIRSYYGH